MTSDPKPNARPFHVVRLPLLGAPRFASRSVGVFLDNDFPLADTAASHAYLGPVLFEQGDSTGPEL